MPRRRPQVCETIYNDHFLAFKTPEPPGTEDLLPQLAEFESKTQDHKNNPFSLQMVLAGKAVIEQTILDRLEAAFHLRRGYIDNKDNPYDLQMEHFGLQMHKDHNVVELLSVQSIMMMLGQRPERLDKKGLETMEAKLRCYYHDVCELFGCSLKMLMRFKDDEVFVALVDARAKLAFAISMGVLRREETGELLVRAKEMMRSFCTGDFGLDSGSDRMFRVAKEISAANPLLNRPPSAPVDTKHDDSHVKEEGPYGCTALVWDGYNFPRTVAVERGYLFGLRAGDIQMCAAEAGKQFVESEGWREQLRKKQGRGELRIGNPNMGMRREVVLLR